MFKLIVMVVVFMVVFAVLKQMLSGKKGSPSAAKPGEFEKIPALLTPAELDFFRVLDRVVGQHYRLFAKVRLADIVRVKRGAENGARQSAFNQIQSKHVDFLACNPNDMQIAFAVELDDSSHAREDRQKRDAFVDTALATSGVTLFRFVAKRSYSEDEVRGAIFAHG